MRVCGKRDQERMGQTVAKKWLADGQREAGEGSGAVGKVYGSAGQAPV